MLVHSEPGDLCERERRDTGVGDDDALGHAGAGRVDDVGRVVRPQGGGEPVAVAVEIVVGQIVVVGVLRSVDDGMVPGHAAGVSLPVMTQAGAVNEAGMNARRSAGCSRWSGGCTPPALDTASMAMTRSIKRAGPGPPPAGADDPNSTATRTAAGAEFNWA